MIRRSPRIRTQADSARQLIKFSALPSTRNPRPNQVTSAPSHQTETPRLPNQATFQNPLQRHATKSTVRSSLCFLKNSKCAQPAQRARFRESSLRQDSMPNKTKLKYNINFFEKSLRQILLHKNLRS